VRALLDQDYEGRYDIVVVDDNSSDDTAAIVRALAADPRGRLVSAPPLPRGGTGKPHACLHGARAGTGSLLCCLPLLVLLSLSFYRPAAAATCPAPAGAAPALAEATAEVRLRFLRDRMEHAARRSRAWTWAWGATHASLLSVNTALLIALDGRGQRIDFAFGAGSSALGVALLLVMPPSVLRDQRRLSRLPGAGADPCRTLAEAERLLAHAAKDDARAKSALLHIGGAIFNLGIGTALGFGFDRWDTALAYIVGGMAIGEIMIATRPADTVRALADYQAGHLGRTTAPAPPRLGLAPVVTSGGGGLSLTLSF
jgi:glycosyltransferase involved in cell wall biosynthesis